MALRDVNAVITITSNATQAIDDGKKLKKVYADIKQQLNEMKAAGKADTTEFKELQKLAQDTEARIKALVTGMRLIEGVINNLANKQGKDINRALRETSREFNKTANDTDKNKMKLERLRETVATLKRELSDRRGLTMSLSDAQKQLNNLNNVNLDQLKTGLAAIKSELEKPIGNRWRIDLEQMQQQYQAAIAVRQTPITQAPVSSMNAAQLRNEQTTLTSALAATQSVKGYESQTAQYATRLKEVNGQLKLLAQNEREADQAAKQLNATQQAADVVQAVYRKQTVSVEELKTAYRTLQQRVEQFTGVNPAKAASARKQLQMIDQEIKRLNGDLLTEKQIQDRVANSGKYNVQQLQQAYNQLQTKLQTLHTNEKAQIRQTKEQMAQLKKQIDSVTGSVGSQSQVWKTAARNITAYVGVFAAFNKVKSLVEGVFESNMKLSDSLANIRKVSGLSSEAINQLYRNISKIDSRNTIETLNQLAYTGAKLGIGQNYGVEGLTGFVKAAEQVQMALGEDMGEKALPELAKMTEVMGLIEKYGVEQSMQKAASAIFQLGATSTATGTNIVEFSKRLYGLANVSRISSDELLALGSASDAMGLMPEVAATAFNKLFTAVQKNHNMIEKTLDLQPGLIKNYYTQGKTMEAIVKIFEKMNETGNLNLLGSVFKDLGSDGARLVNVMATMSDRVDILKKHLDTSRDAFKEGEAVIGEYMIQNQTAQAMLERSSNLWAKAFTNPEGVDMVKELAQAWYDLSKQMTESEGIMWSLKSSLDAIVLAIKTIIALSPYLIRFGIIMASAFGVKSLLTGIASLRTAFVGMVQSISVATASANGLKGAWLGLNAAMKSNLFIGIASAIATVATLLWDFSKAAEEAKKREIERQAKLKQSFDSSREAVQNAIKPIETYKKVLDEANLSEKAKLEMVKQFNTDYQDYLDYLGIEVKTVDDLRDAYARVVDIMKIKKAYEERESYRTEVNGQNRMDRIEAQAKTEAAARSFGIEGVNKEYLEGTQNVRKGNTITSRSTADIYRELVEQKMGVKAVKVEGDEVKFMYIDDKLVDAGTQHGPRAKVRYETISSSELYDALNQYIYSYRTERKTNKETNEKFDSEYTWTDENGKKRKLSEFDIDEYNRKVQEARWKRKGTLDNEAPDKDAAAAAKKAAQEAKQAAREEMKDAQAASTGIISKLEEYYRLQEAAINDARADGELTEDRAKELVRSLNVMKNESLATARRAITTGNTEEWDKMKQTILPTVLADASEQSKQLLNTIQNVQVDVLHKNLAKFNGTDKVFGLDSRAFFDQMNAKAAGNQREAARLRAKIQNEIEKALLQYQFVEKANQKMRSDLETMGFITESYEEFAERMRQGIMEKPDTVLRLNTKQQQARNQMLQRFDQTQAAGAPRPEDMGQWFEEFTDNGQAEWAKTLPEMQKWVRDTDQYKVQIEQLYDLLQSRQFVGTNAKPEDFMSWQQQQQDNTQIDQLVASRISDEQAYRRLGNKFIEQGVINFRYNIENKEEALQWVKEFATNAEGDLEAWAQAFPELSRWVELIKKQEKEGTLGEAEQQALEEAMPAIQDLYKEMLNHADRINKAMKDAYQYEKSQQEMRFRVAGYTEEEKARDKELANAARQRDTGIGQSLTTQLGLGSIANDPEILQIQNRMMWRSKEVEDARARLDAMKAAQQEYLDYLVKIGAAKEEIEAREDEYRQQRAGLEQLLIERQTELAEQTQNLTTKTLQELQKRVSAVQKLTKPFNDAAANIGQKFGEMLVGMDKDSMTWSEIFKNMEYALAESVINMGAQYAQNVILNSAANRAMEADDAAHTVFAVNAGIAAGSAKTIGTLGWIGLALIPVISSLLLGLLKGALLSKPGGDESASAATTTASNEKIKIVSGMLTYDSGNLSTYGTSPSSSPGSSSSAQQVSIGGNSSQHAPLLADSPSGRKPYLGNDGHIYMATAEPTPPTGLITHPIATTVQGQPALVAERGPEIVIGRKTTKSILMNEPELLHHLVAYDRHYSGRSIGRSIGRKMRTYDNGNLDTLDTTDALSGTPNFSFGDSSAENAANERISAALDQNTVVMQTMMQFLQQLQSKGIRAVIDKYGTGGLIEEVKSGLKFDQRYNG